MSNRCLWVMKNRPGRPGITGLLAGAGVFIALAALFGAARASVDLLYFQPADVGDRWVTLEWETATEFDISGFQVERSDQRDGQYQDVSGTIPATGGGVEGAYYDFIDDGLTAGATYWYRLQTYDSNSVPERTGPISVTLELQGGTTPTVTAGPSPTRTPTRTPGPSPIRARTPTRTLTPTRTPTPRTRGTFAPTRTPTRAPTSRPPTATQNYVPAPTVTPAPIPTQTQPYLLVTSTAMLESPTPTTTLIPLPSITIEFPTLTAAPQLLAATRSPDSPAAEKRPGGLAGLLGRAPSGALAVIVLIWLLLAGWLFISLRHMRGP